uniref:Allograft inflammatory factor-1 n=1 Tax=Hirudo medicinalis TaxID=6421 RepID=A0A059V8E8_HIRME|nr:allograft inflammatory factor-1 [Hirudo medicinalis]
MSLDLKDKQGGKNFGKIKQQQNDTLDEINQQYLEHESYKDVEDLAEKLASYKKQFVEFDLDNSGDIDFMELKQMLEKIGQPKTHLECKKMIKEVNKSDTGTICYTEFLDMMLGAKNSVLRLILLFEEKSKKEKESKVKGPPPKKTLDELLNSGTK